MKYTERAHIELDSSSKIIGHDGTPYTLPDGVKMDILFIGLVNNMMEGQDNRNYLLKIHIKRGNKEISYDYNASIADSRIISSEYKTYTFVRGRMVYNSADEYRRNKSKAIDSMLYGIIYTIGFDSADYIGETFEDFCDNLGYDTDSRRALDTYLSCQKISSDLHRIFAESELNEIRERFQ